MVWVMYCILTAFKSRFLGQRLLWSSQYLFPAAFSLYFSNRILHFHVSKFSSPKWNLNFFSHLYLQRFICTSLFAPPTPHPTSSSPKCSHSVIHQPTPSCSKNKALGILSIFFVMVSFLYHLTDLSRFGVLQLKLEIFSNSSHPFFPLRYQCTSKSR